MKAAVLHGIKDIRIDEIDKPALKPDEALVRIRSVGVCGSDVHYYLHGRIGNQVVRGKHILGHEVSGEIAETGKNVKNLPAGTRVAVEPGVPCWKCEHCRAGRYNLCSSIRFLGTPPTNGAYCEYLAWPAEQLHPLPDSVSFEEGALAETMVVGMYAAEASGIKIGDDVAILGCGPIGITVMKAALALGAGRIFAADMVDERLSFARKYDKVVRINASGENPALIIDKLTEGRGADVVFEAAGSLDTVRQSVEIARIGGTVLWIGIPPGDMVSFDTHFARRKELLIKPVRRFRHNYRKCIQALESGYFEVKDMATHRFALNDITEAFTLVENYSDGVIKAVINL